MNSSRESGLVLPNDVDLAAPELQVPENCGEVIDLNSMNRRDLLKLLGIGGGVAVLNGANLMTSEGARMNKKIDPNQQKRDVYNWVDRISRGSSKIGRKEWEKVVGEEMLPYRNYWADMYFGRNFVDPKRFPLTYPQDSSTWTKEGNADTKKSSYCYLYQKNR